jgi:hypothetical protein
VVSHVNLPNFILVPSVRQRTDNKRFVRHCVSSLGAFSDTSTVAPLIVFEYIAIVSIMQNKTKGTTMQRIFTKKSPQPLMWAAGIAIILFSLAGLAAVMAWMPMAIGGSFDNTRLINALENVFGINGGHVRDNDRTIRAIG